VFWWWKKEDETEDSAGGPSEAVATEERRESVVVVSGLPRSGTSLMMQMLEAGGIEPLTDGVRARDEDNPRGYYEMERVKHLPEGDTAWVGQARGRALKVVSALIQSLPREHIYRVIFMHRRIEEVLASQEKMLDRREEGKDTDDEEMAEIFRSHLEEVREWLDDQSNFECLDVDFNGLVADPEPVVEEVNEFLRGDLDTGKMAEVVDPDLYRNRAGE
jgi:hypothetical protein